jgi:transcriptional regulator GlxA family with amidase domain
MPLMHLAHDAERGAVSHQSRDLDTLAGAPRRVPREQLVTRVMKFLRDNLGEPVTVAELSQRAGVSERTLRAAFHDVLGLSPKQYDITERLRAARAALSAADPDTTTVTDIAMTYGFFELGRFAGRYRDVFGEKPSRTLRQAGAACPEQAA